jgi:hypothetical protein
LGETKRRRGGARSCGWEERRRRKKGKDGKGEGESDVREPGGKKEKKEREKGERVGDVSVCEWLRRR